MMDRVMVLSTLLVAATGQAYAAPAARLLPPCQASQLALVLDGVQLDHGAHLVVRNHGMTTCRISGLPPVIFRDAAGHVLPIERQIPPGMHPGPVVLPAAVPAGGSVDARLKWMSDGSRLGGRCYSPTMIEIAIGEQAISHPFQNRLCAAPGQPAKFMQGWFRSASGQETAR